MNPKKLAPAVVKRTYRRILRQTSRVREQLHAREIDLERTLMGGEGTYDAGAWADLTNEPRRASMPLSDSPHYALLKSYEEIGDDLFQPQLFENTPYFRNAAQCIQFHGHYFGTRSRAGILAQARGFTALYSRAKSGEALSTVFPTSADHSRAGQLPLVRPTLTAGTFQVADGHHRLSIALKLGKKRTRAVLLPPGPTELQHLVLKTAQTQGRRELYQPIEGPEFDGTWGLVRRCRDRLQMMTDQLGRAGRPIGGASVLDLGCSYGWFVKEFAARGARALGVDPDPSVLRIGRIAYGLGHDQQCQSSLQGFLASNKRKYDVTLLLSVLHHLARKPDFGGPEEVLRQIDAITNTCLFLDAGQNHEEWFREELPDWNPEHIAELLRKHTTFTRIVPLGVDSDAVSPYGDNYRRTLFACVR